MSEISKKSLFLPVLKTWLKLAQKSTDIIWKPFCTVYDCFSELPNASLFFCGFCFLFVPPIIAYTCIYLAFMLLELALLFVILLAMASIFILIGIWPAFIVSIGALSISIFRFPFNICSHVLVIYRTVVLSKSLKFVNFLLIPIIHVLIPPCVFLLTLISGLACCIGFCLSGLGCLSQILSLDPLIF